MPTSSSDGWPELLGRPPAVVRRALASDSNNSLSAKLGCPDQPRFLGCSSGYIHRRTAPFKNPARLGCTAGQDAHVRTRTPRRRLGKRVGGNSAGFESPTIRQCLTGHDVEGPHRSRWGPSSCVVAVAVSTSTTSVRTSEPHWAQRAPPRTPTRARSRAARRTLHLEQHLSCVASASDREAAPLGGLGRRRTPSWAASFGSGRFPAGQRSHT